MDAVSEASEEPVAGGAPAAGAAAGTGEAPEAGQAPEAGELLASFGPVHPDVAVAMADGVRERLGADIRMATTGVAGPDPADGHPAGTVHIAVSTPKAPVARSLALSGGREDVRRDTVEQSLRLLWNMLREDRT